MTASGSLWLVTTTLPLRPTVFITPRQPSFFTSDAGVRGRSSMASSLRARVMPHPDRARMRPIYPFFPLWVNLWPASSGRYPALPRRRNPRMSAEAASSELVKAVALLGAAVVMVPLFRRIGLGSVLGYLAAGLLIAPFGFGWFSDPQSILHVAELGVVMFLFV